MNLKIPAVSMIALAAVLATSLSPVAASAEEVTPAEQVAFESVPEMGTVQEVLSQSPAQMRAEVNSLTPDEKAALNAELDRQLADALAVLEDADQPSVSVRSSTPPKQSTPAVKAQADKWMFKDSLGSFISYRAGHYTQAPYNWNSDGCSTPTVAGIKIAAGYSSKFMNGCVRHDFGYRNYGERGVLKLSQVGANGRRYDEYREKIDAKLLTDLHSLSGNVADRAVAGTFHKAVRDWGWKYF